MGFRNQFKAAQKLPRSKVIMTVGQSLAESYSNRDGWHGLMTELYSKNWAGGNGLVRLLNAAVGGTSIDESGGTPSGYFWWSKTKNAPAKLLTDALTKAASVPKIDFIIFDLGQADAAKVSYGDQHYAGIYDGLRNILQALKSATNCPIYLQMIGRRGEDAEGFKLGCQTVREAQLNLIKNTNLIDGFVDVYDLPRMDDVHPSYGSYKEIGKRVANLVTGSYSPPEILSVVRSGAGFNVMLSAPINSGISTYFTGFAGKKEDGSYIEMRALLKNPTTIYMEDVFSGHVDFSHICYPFDNIKNQDSFIVPRSADGLPIKSCLKILTT